MVGTKSAVTGSARRNPKLGSATMNLVKLLVLTVFGAVVGFWAKTRVGENISAEQLPPSNSVEEANSRQAPVGITKSLREALARSPQSLAAAAAAASQEHPQAVLAWAAGQTPTPALESAVREAASRGVECDAAGTLAAALAVGEPRLREAALAGLWTRWVQIDSSAAWAALKESGNAGFGAFAAAWAAEDFPAAWEKLQSPLPTPEIQAAMLQAVVPEQQSPAARTLLAQLLVKSQNSDAATWQRLLQASPKQAMAAWQEWPQEDPQRGTLLRTLANTWAEIDLPGLSQWIQPQQPQAVKPAIEALLRQLDATDPSAGQAYRASLPKDFIK